MNRDLVFICYRLSDTVSESGWLESNLRLEFGKKHLFRDDGSILAGQPIPESIEAALRRTRAMLVMIGRTWLTVVEPDGTRRLDNPDDWVRREIEAALGDTSIQVIPVLVDGAEMPKKKLLPPSMKSLSSRRALSLRHAQFDTHADAIANRLRELGIVSDPPKSQDQPKSPNRSWLDESRPFLQQALADPKFARCNADWPLQAHLFDPVHKVNPISQVLDFLAGRESNSARLDPMPLFEKIRNGLLVVSAPGGFGKTSLLVRLANQLLEANKAVFYFDFRRAERPVQGQEPGPRELAQSMLVGRPDSIARIEKVLAEPDLDKVIIVDGLNESSFFDADRVLQFFVDLRSLGSQTTLVVGDRMVSRAQYSQFRAATVALLADDFLQSQLATASGATDLGKLVGPNWQGWRPLLAIPFFLDLALRIAARSDSGGNVPVGRYQLVTDYFADQLVKDQTEPEKRRSILERDLLPTLAQGAFSWYECQRSVVAPRKDALAYFAGLGNDAGLLSGSLFVATSGAFDAPIRFTHQLFHDYLVGSWIAGAGASNPLEGYRRWTAERFGIATLSKNGFDALEFAAEALASRASSPLSADAFLREVYDWDYSATLRILARLARANALQVVSAPMRLAMRLANLEKLKDRFLHSVTRTRQELRELPDDLGFSLQTTEQLDTESADTFEESLRALCKNHSAFNESIEAAETEYWRSWHDLYCSQRAATAEDLHGLCRDPLFGWTAANVFRRPQCRPSTDVFDEVRRWYAFSRQSTDSSSGPAMARWRLVHLLGVDAREPTFRFLLKVVEDCGTATKLSENEYVRYGAVRSLIEIVSETQGNVNSMVDLIKSSVRIGFILNAIDTAGRRRVATQLETQVPLSNYSTHDQKTWNEQVVLPLKAIAAELKAGT